MTEKEILRHCDHTLLSTTATWEDIKVVLDDGMFYHVASVCIPQYFVRRAKEYVGDKVPICTVIGFPNGYNSAASKVFEATEAIMEGADEIDMVIDLCALKEGNVEYVKNEIAEVKKACGNKILKVIVETCLLTEEEKILMCDVVSEAGADYIKTSTGFSKWGATFHDVELFKEHVAPGVKIKAAGGISSLADAEQFLSLGADRLGTSRVVKIVKEENF